MDGKKIGGIRLQSGIRHSKTVPGGSMSKANGLLLRGCVMATYVLDDTDHPYADNASYPPVAVYCDVVVTPSIPNQKWFFLSKVLVSQKRGGLHDDEIWKPKASTQNVVTENIDTGTGSNVNQFDGDHVLIGFLNNSLDQPIILRGLPHPSRDVGNEVYDVGKRLKLKLVDGNPDFVKHNGVFRGVDGSGNHVIDSTFGNDGTYLSAGIEKPTDITGSSGNQRRKLPKDAVHEISFFDMTSPASPVEVAKYTVSKEAFEILITLLPCLKVEGNSATASLTLGDGAVSATIAERLATLWGQLKNHVDTHVHEDATGGTGAPTTLSPAWDSNIESNRLTFPDL